MDDILDEKGYEARTLKYATFLQRCIAFLIDILLIGIICFALNRTFGIAPTFYLFVLLNWWKLILILFFYFVLFEGGEYNASIGKQMMHIRFLDEDKRTINYGIAALHFLLSIILFLGIFRLLFNSNHQTLADKFCKVIVVEQ